MPAFKFPSPILYLASEPSFFAVLDGTNKNQSLKDVTRIDFPLIEKGVINKENLTHALKSLEQKSIHLVVSDEIFYHHISDYTLGAKKNIEDEIKETVATVFADKKDPLHIVTVDLAKTSKMQTVQITAMTKENLANLAEAAKEAKVEIESIIPASFVVKAFVSVDPSLFLLVTSQNFLLTSHYIGVDFAQNISKENVKELISTVKTLKKERPHIQHIYICADEGTDPSISEDLTEVMPIQDVEVKKIETESDTPFFLKALTIGVKEVIENDFPLPHFSVQNADASAASESKSNVVEEAILEPIAEILKDIKNEDKAEEKDEKEEVVAIVLDEEAAEEEEEELKKEVLVKPSEKAEEKETKVEIDSETETVEKKEEVEIAIEPLPIPTPVIPAAAKAVEKEIEVVASPKVIAATPSKDEENEEEKEEPKTVEAPVKVVSTVRSTETTSTNKSSVRPAKKGSVFKYVLLTFGVALLISLIGGGIVISQQAMLNQKNPTLQTPVTSVTPTDEEEEPTPTPKPTAAPVDMEDLDILVVNATSIAGKAGKVATGVKKTGAKSVDTGNAKDSYDDEGTFIMLAKPELSGAISVLEEETGLTFDEQEMSSKENPSDKYDIVIVLNE